MQKGHKESIELLKNRYSCRQFSNKKIEDDVLNDILDVGVRAASGGNLQPVSVIMVRDKDRKDKIKELCHQGFISDADTLLIYVLDYHRLNHWAQVQDAPCGRPNSFIDFLIAMEDVMCVAQSIECAATILGVGSVYIGTVNYNYDKLKELLNLPDLTIPVVMSCLGYAKGESEGHLQGHLRKKLSKDVLIHNEQYKVLTDDEVRKEIIDKKYNNWLQELTGDVLEKYKKELYEVTLKVHGEDYANKVVRRIDKQGGINRAQFRLGHHYNPVRQRSHNKRIIDFYKKQGFNFWTE